VRGIFFDEDQARAVAARLAADGYDVRMERERFANEDDDEDHPWAVLTDAPEPVLDLLVDEYDGWLDAQ
jgi:8-oxo-dGTP diphosphatase